MASRKVGGLLMRIDGTLVYLPAAVALKLAPVPQIARVPGAPRELLGVALHGGEILPILSVGGARESMVVCTYAGALLGIVGGHVVGTGMFDIAEDGASASYKGETAIAFDLADLCAQVQTASWRGHWHG
jgi:hypothetical protein